jgi:hypothetical protein
MFKNVASKIALYAFDATTGLPKTGDAAQLSAYVSKDHGAVTALADTTATEVSAANAAGWYLFDTTAAESNADALLFTGKSSTANVVVVARPIYTRPVNFAALNITALGAVNIQSRLKSGQAFANYRFLMTSTVDNSPITGRTVTATRALDGGAQAAGTLSAVTEIGGGEYRLDLSAGDLTAAATTLMLAASGAQTQFITLYLEP